MHVQPFKYAVADNSKTFTIAEGTTSIIIRNIGNIYSKPIMTITGTGKINLYLNGVQGFAINIGDIEQTIAIDINNMNAYNPSNNNFLNRLVTGNYDNFKLAIGKNTITWTGSITQMQIQNFSRWI